MLRQPNTGKGWAHTPTGRQHVSEVLGKIDAAGLEAELSRLGSAELSDARHPLIPPELAPLKFSDAVKRLVSDFAFDRNVFVMTRFPKDEPETDLPDPVREVLTAARAVADTRGLTLHLASDRNADDQLFGNVAAHMWACRFGLGLFETRYSKEFNDNLQIEVGGMLMTGRQCALLKDIETPDMPTDFVGQIYTPVDFTDLSAVERAVEHAFDGFLLGARPSRPPR